MPYYSPRKGEGGICKTRLYWDYNFYVYIMASITKVLYIGMANNLLRRVTEHKEGKHPGFSQKYQTKKLVFYEHFQYVNDAIAREKELKGWRREKKVKLIEDMNPLWHDLFQDING